jgi:hypothetical protein
MVRKFKVYNGSTLLKEGDSPLQITGLNPLTKYDLTISALEDGKESNKVDVPTFTTLGINILKTIKASDFVTKNGGTLEDVDNSLKLTSDGTARIVMNTSPTSNNVLIQPMSQGKRYRLSGRVKLDNGYLPTDNTLRTLRLTLSGYVGAVRILATNTPIPISTTEYLEFSGDFTAGDLTAFTSYYLTILSDTASERFTGTLYLKDIAIREIEGV